VQGIQITMAEAFDVADRGSFYDKTGAIRDVVQNHMLQVLATALAARFTVSDLAGLDLSYAPPFAPVYDPVLAAAIKADHAVHTAPAAPLAAGRAAPGGSA